MKKQILNEQYLSKIQKGDSQNHDPKMAKAIDDIIKERNKDSYTISKSSNKENLYLIATDDTTDEEANEDVGLINKNNTYKAQYFKDNGRQISIQLKDSKNSTQNPAPDSGTTATDIFKSITGNAVRSLIPNAQQTKTPPQKENYSQVNKPLTEEIIRIKELIKCNSKTQ